mgnify:CR=1 FL=1
MAKPLIVVWEGLDAAGKTTLISKVKSALEEMRYKVLVYKTPSRSKTGEFARTYGNDPEIDPLTRMLLFLANTSDDSRIMRRQIREKSPDFYFIDRYHLCSIAYGFAFSKLRGGQVSEKDFKLFFELVEKLGEGVFVKPDLYLIIDAPEEDRARRLDEKESQGGLEDELERDVKMQEYVRSFYEAFRSMRPEKVVWVMNPQGRLEEVASRIIKLLLSRIKKS